MNDILETSSLSFDFSAIGGAEKFDDPEKVVRGLKAVDFFAETDDCLYFVEVKNYQNPKTPPQNLKDDYEQLISAVKHKEESMLVLKFAAKIKDSFLRRYAAGDKFTKKALYLLLIHMDKFSARERGLLADRIAGHIGAGLNESRFTEFKEIEFKLVDTDSIRQYGIKANPIT